MTTSNRSATMSLSAGASITLTKPTGREGSSVNRHRLLMDLRSRVAVYWGAACLPPGCRHGDRAPGTGLAGGHDEVRACVEVERGGVDHQVVQARIFAIDAVRTTDVSDPGPVRDLQAALSGLTINAGERHPLLQARFTGAAQVD